MQEIEFKWQRETGEIFQPHIAHEGIVGRVHVACGGGVRVVLLKPRYEHAAPHARNRAQQVSLFRVEAVFANQVVGKGHPLLRAAYDGF